MAGASVTNSSKANSRRGAGGASAAIACGAAEAARIAARGASRLRSIDGLRIRPPSHSLRHSAGSIQVLALEGEARIGAIAAIGAAETPPRLGAALQLPVQPA